jgi:hypothetical protein
MSHFQLPDGTRLWARDFKDEKIAIHLGNEIELEQWGSTDAFGKTPKITLDKQGVVELRLIARPSSDKPFEISKRRFGLTAVGEGIATLSGKNDQGSITTDPLKIVAGEFKNHKRMVKDLLADVGRSSNPSLSTCCSATLVTTITTSSTSLVIRVSPSTIRPSSAEMSSKEAGRP